MTTDSDCRGWTSLADLLTADAEAHAALLGAPLAGGSLTPGRCDLAPTRVRATLPRISVYDLETQTDLSGLRVRDCGDVDLKLADPARAFAPVCDAMRNALTRAPFVILLGGNNAITRPAVHALDEGVKRVGLLTLDAHFDLRDTDCGLTNGNPVQALLEDGLPGAHIAQVGLAPFANTKRAHQKAIDAGIHVVTLRNCKQRGLAPLAIEALEKLSATCDAIHVDFDIDVIDRAQCPGAPGARPGGVDAQDFFDAARAICAHPKVRSIDLTEYDPSLDVADQTALIAARFIGEALAGLQARRTL